MSGKCSRTLIPGISVGGAFITSQADIANTIASSFLMVFSSDNYDPCFIVIRDSAETFPLSFTHHVTEAYNTPSTWTNSLQH
jgi:hypothetical protein